MKVTTNSEFFDDICEVVRLFFPLVSFDESEDFVLDVQNTTNENQTRVETTIFDGQQKHYVYEAEQTMSISPLETKKHLKRIVKSGSYLALSEHLGIKKDWGSHTGVRPTRLAYEMLADGKSMQEVKEYLTNQFHISLDKANLVEEVIENQGKLTTDDKDIHVYVHIPFCPSRCSYCSFIAFDNKNNQSIIEEYLNKLILEIEHAKKMIEVQDLRVQSVYIGGGTPTTLNAEQLDKLLSHLSFDVRELTVECGRPDTFTIDKLEVMQKHGVSRICINPQTFHDKTLQLIGRHHNTEQTLQAYEMSRTFPFAINMDLIAGLPGETFDDFAISLNRAVELNPASITVHTLAIKNGAFLMNHINIETAEQDVSKMVQYAKDVLANHQYLPYYLYRQKHQLSSQENIGYAKKGKGCRFNIESMEETATILACGAGAISKRVFHKQNRIERCANIKAVPIYLERFEDVLKRKEELFLEP